MRKQIYTTVKVNNVLLLEFVTCFLKYFRITNFEICEV